MGLILEFDSKNNLLRMRAEGPVSDAIMLDAYAQAGRYVASHGPCRAIVDVSGVTKFEVSADAIRGLARSEPAIPTGYMRVFVAPQAHVYGMVRMFQILGEGTRPDLHVVRTMDEAYRLLRVESPEFSRVG